MTDLRFAARSLVSNRGFTAMAVLLLALGIGGTTVIFSALDAVLLRPLPVRHPEQLVRMVQTAPQLGTRSTFVEPYYRALRDHSKTLSQVFGDTDTQVILSDPGPSVEIRAGLVTPEFFDALGVAALYGRTLNTNDNDAPVAVLSYGFWRSRFNGDPGVIGRTMTMNRHRFTIVGVMPRGFNGISADTTPEVRVPLRCLPLLSTDDPKAIWQDTWIELAGRLKPGVTLAQARDECRAIWKPVMQSWFKTPEDLEIELTRGMDLEAIQRGVSVLRARFGPALRLLIACVGLLQLLVCASVAGLLLARGAARREEIAVRLAMGATRRRLLRLVLTETALLTAIGAAAGVLLAYAAAPLLVRALPPMRDFATMPLTVSLDLTPDARILLFSIALAVFSAALSGMLPALAVSRISLDAVLRSVRSTAGWRGRQALVIFQIAVCTLLLATAALLSRTFQKLHDQDPGFDRFHIVTFTLDPSLIGYTEAQIKALHPALLQRVRDLPNVVAVAEAERPVMRGSGLKTTVAPAGQRAAQADFLNSSLNEVSPEYFDAMGMRVVAGRSLTVADASVKKPAPVVVNEAFARRFFPHADPLGKLFGLAARGIAKADDQIVGVVSDAHYRSMREPIPPTIYTPIHDSVGFELLVRTRARPAALIGPVRRVLATLDPALAFNEVHTLSAEVDASTAGERLTAALATGFGALAAMLAAAGIYALLALAVAQRRREIGIRMALGARPGDIGELIGRQAIVMVASGLALGLAAAVLVTPLLRSLLYGVTPLDPASLIAAAVFVVLAAVFATAVPALRASRIEPATALRQTN